MINDIFGGKGPAKDVTAEIETELKKLETSEKIKLLAIYKLYKDIKKIDAEKEKETKIAEKNSLKLEEPILTNQNAIINGERDIKIEEVKDAQKFLTEQERTKIGDNLGAHRIPEYWLKSFKNTDILKDQVRTPDEQALKYLRNIRVNDEEGNDNFEIVFSFDQNPFFSQKELKKKFFMINDYPTKTIGTEITWNQGKDLSKKQVKKKQKNKKTGQNRVISKIVDADSFFNFFKSSELPEGKDPMTYDDNQQQIAEKIDVDFEIGGAIIDECVPYSLEYYLGVKAENEEDDQDFDQDDEDDEDDEDAESKKSSKQKKPKKAAKGAVPADGVEKPECKQQ